MPPEDPGSIYREVTQSFKHDLGEMAAVIKDQEAMTGRIDEGDLKYVMSMNAKIIRLALRIPKMRQRDRERRVKNSIRYLKRSGNQLIRSIRGLHPMRA